jgi:hypothetical protein
MATYEVMWLMEINGNSPQDAADQAVAFMQERTGTVTVRVRRQHGSNHGPWEPAEVTPGPSDRSERGGGAQ